MGPMITSASGSVSASYIPSGVTRIKGSQMKQLPEVAEGGAGAPVGVVGAADLQVGVVPGEDVGEEAEAGPDRRICLRLPLLYKSADFARSSISNGMLAKHTRHCHMYFRTLCRYR